jgi:hypothetical protein
MHARLYVSISLFLKNIVSLMLCEIERVTAKRPNGHLTVKTWKWLSAEQQRVSVCVSVWVRVSVWVSLLLAFWWWTIHHYIHLPPSLTHSLTHSIMCWRLTNKSSVRVLLAWCVAMLLFYSFLGPETRWATHSLTHSLTHSRTYTHSLHH